MAQDNIFGVRQSSNTNINYIFYGMPVDRVKHMTKTPYKVSIGSWEKDKLAKIAKTGQFTYLVPEMWEKTAKSGGYDIICTVDRVEKETEFKSWTYEDIKLEDIAL